MARLLTQLDFGDQPQGAQMVGHRTGRQLMHCEELRLVLPNVLPAQTVRRTVEVLCESFDEADVVLWGSLRVSTTVYYPHHTIWFAFRSTKGFEEIACEY
jgi:hypothetical protein